MQSTHYSASFRIAIGQIRVKAGILADNFEQMKSKIISASLINADAIVFPEMALPGYFLGDFLEYESFLKDIEFYHLEILKLSLIHSISIIFGSVGIDWNKKNEDGLVRKYNALFCASEGQFVLNKTLNTPYWPKALLPNYHLFDDTRHFFDLRRLASEKNKKLSECLEPLIINPNKRNKNRNPIAVIPMICEDSWTNHYALQEDHFSQIIENFSQASLVINISSSPYFHQKYVNERIPNFSQLACKLHLPTLMVNPIGVQNRSSTIVGFDGLSSLFYPNLDCVPLAGFFEEGLNQIDLISEKTFQWICPKPYPLISNNPIEEKVLAIEAMLRFVCDEWKINRVLIGLSGGIDSALSAVIFSRVLDSQNVFTVNMPSQFNSSLTQNAAKTLAENLNCPFAILPIQDSSQTLKNDLEKLSFLRNPFKPNVSSFAFENIQSRDRGNKLAALSSLLSAPIVCNANKSEITIGYATLYGDLIGFIAPLADLWKDDIYQLAHFYNETVFQKKIIPADIFTIPPSAELSVEQNVMLGKGDPVHYPYHDKVFQLWLEGNNRLLPVDILKAFQTGKLFKMLGVDETYFYNLFSSPKEFIDDLEKYWNLYKGAGPIKRKQSPPILALSARSYGADEREYIGQTGWGLDYEKIKNEILVSEF